MIVGLADGSGPFVVPSDLWPALDRAPGDWRSRRLLTAGLGLDPVVRVVRVEVEGLETPALELSLGRPVEGAEPTDDGLIWARVDGQIVQIRMDLSICFEIPIDGRRSVAGSSVASPSGSAAEDVSR